MSKIKGKKQIKDEYNRLASEISSNSDKIFNLLKLMITVSISILSIGFTKWLNDYEVIFLMPITLIIPLNFLINSQLNSTERIAGYLRIFIEPKLKGYNWEGNLKEFRDKYDKRSKFSSSIIKISIGLSTLCYALCFINLSSKHKLDICTSWRIYIFILFTLIFLIDSMIKLSETKDKKFDKKWESIINSK